eukprot:m51a1_g2398 putative protein phosphatase 4 catalytic subunit (305) ;mRNA; f:758916-759992
MSRLDTLIDLLKKGETPAEQDVHWLCELVKDLSWEEGNVVQVHPPVVIAGDVHGQLEDTVRAVLKTGGWPPQQQWLFLGDMVDRGHHSLETVLLLFALKARFPDKVTLLRGNHESRAITQVYGFYDEVVKKYGRASAWRWCTDAFDMLPISALVGDSVFCVHGGLSPTIPTLDSIQAIVRKREVPLEGSMCELLWSDPEDIDGWAESPRGAGLLYGGDVVAQWNHINRLALVARAHQLAMAGYEWKFGRTLITVWSAPNYCYRCGNPASVFCLDENLDYDIRIFEAASREGRRGSIRTTPLYFL